MPAENVPIKYCRHCGRLIHLGAADCPYCGQNTIRQAEGPVCPFCKESIKPGAIKCRHCGEFLDGRASDRSPGAQPESSQPVLIQIENAIIANANQPGGPGLLRPDGSVIDVDRVPARALPEGSADAPAAAAELPGEERRALPGATANVPAVVDAEVTDGDGPRVPARVEPEPKPQKKTRKPRKERKKKKEKRGKPKPETTEAPDTMPPVQYPCPACDQAVLEGDNFCENCGRDLSLHPDQPEFPRGRLSAVADYALICGLAAPLTIPLPMPWALSLGVLGVLLGVWAIVRIQASRGRLKGTLRAVIGLVVALFWLLVIGVFTG